MVVITTGKVIFECILVHCCNDNSAIHCRYNDSVLFCTGNVTEGSGDQLSAPPGPALDGPGSTPPSGSAPPPGSTRPVVLTMPGGKKAGI